MDYYDVAAWVGRLHKLMPYMVRRGGGKVVANRLKTPDMRLRLMRVLRSGSLLRIAASRAEARLGVWCVKMTPKGLAFAIETRQGHAERGKLG